MGIVVILLVQLWSQPSVRLLGFGRYFAGYVPDPITDLTWNPAYIKTLGENVDTYNTPQIYAMTRVFNSATLIEQSQEEDLFVNEELASLYGVFPKLGLACRIGGWQRTDIRNYHYQDPWFYGQGGLLGSIRLCRWMKVGCEYSHSRNKRPDIFCNILWNTGSNPQEVTITQESGSNEFGIGIILTDREKIEMSISGKTDEEVRKLFSDVPYPFGYGSEGEVTTYEAHYNNTRVNARLRYMSNRFIYSANFTYMRNNIERDGINEYSDYSVGTIRPGAGVIYYPTEDLFVTASVIVLIDWIDDDAYTPSIWNQDKRIMFLIGLEAPISKILKFRLGNNLTYGFGYALGHRFINEPSLGLELTPYEKLTLNFATGNPLDYAFWYFGISFVL